MYTLKQYFKLINSKIIKFDFCQISGTFLYFDNLKRWKYYCIFDKIINMSEKEIIFLIEESLDGGYEAKALGHSIYTEGETISELKRNIKNAVKCHFDSKKIPSVIRLHFIREELIAV